MPADQKNDIVLLFDKFYFVNASNFEDLAEKTYSSEKESKFLIELYILEIIASIQSAK